jgi:murein DD-endopeptidase MepM/ murein hydrolase activator NlpD
VLAGMTSRAAVLALVLAGTTACVGPGGLLMPTTPHAAYVVMLWRSGLADSADGQQWLGAARRVLDQATVATTPSIRTGALGTGPADARALGYRVSVPRGRRLSVAVDFESATPAPLFVDLFRLDPGAPPRQVAALPAGRRSLVHDVDGPGDYVVRAQTQLAASGRATVAVRTLASLPFPIAGVDRRGMQSGFGVARDAGRRQHQGIDIFAPRGTPVRAVAGGIARAGSNRLGGTVVWVYAPTQGRTFYYAHLDRHAIGAMAMVAAGDVIGYVGNTGNARTTPPHLHFGIYEGGAIDPWPFVQPDQPVPELSSTDPPRRQSGRRRPA